MSQRVLIKPVRESSSQIASIPSQAGTKAIVLTSKGSSSSSHVGSRRGYIPATPKNFTLAYRAYRTTQGVI